MWSMAKVAARGSVVVVAAAVGNNCVAHSQGAGDN